MKDRNLSRIVEQEIFNYARENLAVINIFIKARFTNDFVFPKHLPNDIY